MLLRDYARQWPEFIHATRALELEVSYNQEVCR